LLADVATVLRDTGLRPDEAHRLDWADISFMNGRHGKLLVRYGKTAAARRELPLTPRLRSVLEARWKNAGQPCEGWVFPAPTVCWKRSQSLDWARVVTKVGTVTKPRVLPVG